MNSCPRRKKDDTMEIERKFTIKKMPEDIEMYDKRIIEQAYLCTKPVIRVRRDNEKYYLTCKGSGLTAHTELEFPLDERSYEHMKNKADGNIISKTRFMIPIDKPMFKDGYVPADGLKLTVELDIFDAPFSPLVIAEVEFPDIQTCEAYTPEPWFDSDVTDEKQYHNSYLSSMRF